MSRVKAQFIKAKKNFTASQQSQTDAFAIDRWDGGHTDIDFFTLDANVDASILR